MFPECVFNHVNDGDNKCRHKITFKDVRIKSIETHATADGVLEEEDLAEMGDFLISVLPQHSMVHLYQAIAKSAHSQYGKDHCFNAYASFDDYERQLLLPPPFTAPYPGEMVENLYSKPIPQPTKPHFHLKTEG